MLNTILEEKDSYTAGHCKRVAFYSSEIASILSLNQEEQNTAYHVGLLHDIGKILTPEAVLLKPKKLTKKEFHVIQKHVTDSERIVESITPFKHYLPLIRHHHEHYNGGGYPDQLKQEEIPLISRILCVADSFDAMTTNRIYKKRKTNTQAINELTLFKHKQFDPNVVEAAIEFFQTFDDLAHINQLPESFIQEERFAFFYKDGITKAYTSEYLNHFLTHPKKRASFSCCYLVELHHTHRYNTHYGWKAGNNLLKELTIRLKVLFKESLIFRVFGDDFIVLCNHPLETDSPTLSRRLGVGFAPIDVRLTHFPFKEIPFKHWEEFEPFLTKTLRLDK
jgi:putative nucleotidyltransferase with HDIG domain